MTSGDKIAIAYLWIGAAVLLVTSVPAWFSRRLQDKLGPLLLLPMANTFFGTLFLIAAVVTTLLIIT